MDDAPKTEGEGDKKIIHVYPLVKVSTPYIFLLVCILNNSGNLLNQYVTQK